LVDIKKECYRSLHPFPNQEKDITKFGHKLREFVSEYKSNFSKINNYYIGILEYALNKEFSKNALLDAFL